MTATLRFCIDARDARQILADHLNKHVGVFPRPVVADDVTLQFGHGDVLDGVLVTMDVPLPADPPVPGGS